MKPDRKTLILTTLVCLLPLVAGALVYSRLPESVPTHFDFNGDPDGWSSPAVAAFALPSIPRFPTWKTKPTVCTAMTAVCVK